MTGRHAALDSAVPYHAWVLPELCSTLTSAYEHQRPKLLITLRDYTKAPFLRPNNRSAYTRSCSLYNHTTAVSLRYLDPFHLCVCVKQRRSSSSTRSACQSLDSDLGIL